MWMSLQHVMKNGRICVPTVFLWRSRYALHVIPSYYKQDEWRPLPWLPPSTSRADEEPYYLPHKNDGWHHVSSTSAQTARCKGFISSCHQGSQLTCKLQQLDTTKKKQSPWKHSNSAFCVVTMTQTQSCNNRIKSHKAWLNLHGEKQVYIINYFETNAPVVPWFAIRLMIIFGIIFLWALWQVDFVMAYLQAPIEMDLYMECWLLSKIA